jgi:hypothetical protein
MVNSTFMGAPEGFPRFFRPEVQKPLNVFHNSILYIIVYVGVMTNLIRGSFFKYNTALGYLD